MRAVAVTARGCRLRWTTRCDARAAAGGGGDGEGVAVGSRSSNASISCAVALYSCTTHREPVGDGG
eukprot:336195-Prymnesium_polylepis.1